MEAKQSKIIVRDSSGNLIQVLPEVKVDQTVSQSSSSPVSGSAVAAYVSGGFVGKTGNESISGQKKFLGGLYGGAYTLGSSEWDFDLTKATCFTKTVAGEGTFSFSNVPEATVCCITVILHNGGNYAIHWPASVKWTENETPTLTQNGTDVLTFITCTGGNIWYGTTTCIGVTA